MLASLLLLAFQEDRYAVDAADKDFDAAMEKAYAVWARELGGKFDGRADAFVHEKDEDYEAVAPKQTFSHYDPAKKQVHVKYDRANRARGKANAQRYLAFEGTRQFLHLAFPAAYADMPAWLEEGLAEYFGAAEGKLHSPNAIYTHANVMTLQRLIREKKAPKVSDVVAMKREDLAKKRGIEGVVAWALVYYFMNAPDDSGGRGADKARLLNLLQGKPEDLFGDKPDVFQKKLFDYVAKLKAEVPSKDDGKFLNVETEHYTIQVDRNAADLRKLTEDGERIMEVIFTKYQEAFRAEGKLSQKPIARFYADREAYWKSGAPRQSAAYYRPDTKELVGYSDDQSFNVMCHEGCHQFFDLSFPGFYMQEDLPMWFSEGLADAFGAGDIRGKELYIFSLKGIAKWRIPTLKNQVVKQKKYTPLRTLIAMGQKEFMEESVASLHYAQSWSLCHFLWNYPSIDEGNGKYREVVVKLIEGFKAGRPRDDVYKDAFQLKGKPLSIDDLQDEWMGYLKKLPDK